MHQIGLAVQPIKDGIHVLDHELQDGCTIRGRLCAPLGREVLDLALADGRVASVVAPGRKPLPRHAKLTAPRVNFRNLPEAPWWQADAAICTLGASLMAAGSREEFRRIDHDYVLSAARRIRDASTPTFVLLSACRAHPRSWFFYTRTKGELEENLALLISTPLLWHDPP